MVVSVNIHATKVRTFCVKLELLRAQPSGISVHQSKGRKRPVYEVKRLVYEVKWLVYEGKRLVYGGKRLVYEVKRPVYKVKRLVYEVKR